MNLVKLYLTVNPYSRPGKPIKTVRGLVVHWYENPGQSARSVREYFELRKEGKHQYGSAHYCVDEEDVVACVPEDEMAYHVGAHSYTDMALRRFGPYPNSYLLGIEMAHSDWTGKPDEATEHYAIELSSILCSRYVLNPQQDIFTHTQITGKVTKMGPCHKWYHTYPDAFLVFKNRIKEMMGKTIDVYESRGG